MPSAECLRDTYARVDAVWIERIQPALLAGKNVMVVSHGNTLRALVKLVDRVSDEDTYHLDLPTAAPVVYPLDADCRPLQTYGFWGDSSVPRHGRFLMDDALVAAAQRVMREQVERNLATPPHMSEAATLCAQGCNPMCASRWSATWPSPPSRATAATPLPRDKLTLSHSPNPKP